MSCLQRANQRGAPGEGQGNGDEGEEGEEACPTDGAL